MKKLKNKSVADIAALILFVNLTVSCKKFVQINTSSTQIATASVFNDATAATAALTVIYSQMQPESFLMSQQSGLLSDELQSPSNQSDVYQPYTNQLSPFNDVGCWSRAYKYIAEANAVIEGLNNSKTIDISVQNQLIGEAKFIRAFWDFYLVNNYGNIPLVNTTDYKKNAILPRMLEDTVYDNIINDLKDAEQLLNASYVDDSDTASTAQERIRPNKATAIALLARIYLYKGRYADAEMQSNVLLTDSRYSLVGLDSVFLMNSSEAIWQLGVPIPNIYNTTDAFNFVLNGAPDPTQSVNTSTISTWLMKNFEPGDQRQTNWIGTKAVTNPDTIYYYPFKYKETSTNITEYTMMLRLAEQYLIHAEALARQNKSLTQAVSDINAIRHRAGLGDYSGPTESADSILAAVLQERRVELFVEWGHRWFDLKRTGKVNDVMSVITPLKGGTAWAPEWALFPIPFGELQADPNLTQNPGY